MTTPIDNHALDLAIKSGVTPRQFRARQRQLGLTKPKGRPPGVLSATRKLQLRVARYKRRGMTNAAIAGIVGVTKARVGQLLKLACLLFCATAFGQTNPPQWILTGLPYDKISLPSNFAGVIQIGTNIYTRKDFDDLAVIPRGNFVFWYNEKTNGPMTHWQFDEWRDECRTYPQRLADWKKREEEFTRTRVPAGWWVSFTNQSPPKGITNMVMMSTVDSDTNSGWVRTFYCPSNTPNAHPYFTSFFGGEPQNPSNEWARIVRQAGTNYHETGYRSDGVMCWRFLPEAKP